MNNSSTGFFFKSSKFSIGTSKGSDDAVNWFDSDSSAGEMIVTSLVENTQYYSNARVTDAVGNISDVTSSDGFKMDYTGPEKGSLIAPNFTSGIIELSWSGFSDNGSGINHYYYINYLR